MSAEKLKDLLSVAGVIDPDAYAANTYDTGWIDMADFQEVLFAVQAGDIVTSGVLNFKVREAKTSTGGSAQDLAATAITALTQAGTDSNKQALVNVEAGELSEGFRYISGRLVLSTAGADASLIALGARGPYSRASDLDLGSVDEIVP